MIPWPVTLGLVVFAVLGGFLAGAFLTAAVWRRRVGWLEMAIHEERLARQVTADELDAALEELRLWKDRPAAYDTRGGTITITTDPADPPDLGGGAT